MTQSNNKRQGISNSFLIALITQVGCLTLVIILISLLGGLWLDKTFGTRPLFTLLLLLAGTPISVIVMLYVSRRAVARIKSQPEKEEDEPSS
ncbi:MAG TPA: AtpZ/AtpI family protein [Anaerolineales bacterium]|nr:AtpZ/AtpI family protein [Anaerolineales bacterium]